MRNQVELLEVYWHCIVSSEAPSPRVSSVLPSFLGGLGFEFRVALWALLELRSLAAYGGQDLRRVEG